MTATTIIGKALPRIDSAEKVHGQTRYAGDLTAPGLLHAKLTTAYQAHANIKGVDTSEALKVPGVKAIYTGKDLIPDGPEPASRPMAMLARDKVVFYGQPVAIVLAETEEAAEEAAALVQVNLEPLGVNVDPVKSTELDAPAIRSRDIEAGEGEGEAHATVSGGAEMDVSNLGPNVTDAVAFKRGDAEKGFADADVVVERTYRTHSVHQGYIEPQAVMVVPDPLGRITIYTPTQGQFFVRNMVSNALGMEHNQITVVPMEVGGGFGGKTCLLQPLVAAAAVRAKQPVKIVLSRMEEFLLTTPAPGSVIEVKTGAKKDGTVTAIKVRALFDSGAYPASPTNVAVLISGGYYRCENLDLEGIEVITNKPGVGAYRAPGSPQGTFAIDQNMDEMARQLGWDPIDFRLHSISVEGDLQPNDEPWPAIGAKEVLEAIKEHPLYKNKPTGRGEGIGVAVGGWPGGVEPCAAHLRLNTDGTVNLALGSMDISGTNTTMAMIAAETFGVRMDQVRLTTANTDSAPYAGMSGGSKVTYTMGLAVEAAAQEARHQVMSIASSELEVSPDDLELVDGEVRVKGAPDTSLTLSEIATMSMSFGGKYPPVSGNGKSAVQDKAPGFSAQLAHVHVDEDTGEVELKHLVVAQDVGKALNPAMVEGQIMGGAVQGIGWGLYEGIIYDNNGQPLNPNFMDYALPKLEQSPPMDIILVEKTSKAGPYGAKGVGEPPVVPTAAAIANAIADATNGARMTEIPMTSQRVLEAIARRDS
jgi:CO/xanthine dehydrogenase Mo-binding subunit